METSHTSKNCKYRTLEKYNNKFTLLQKLSKSKPCLCVSHLFNTYYYFVLSIYFLIVYLKKNLAEVFSLDVRRVWRYQRGNHIP